MRDYSGGERTQSSYGQQHVKAIQEGRTQSQVDRNLREKIVMGGIQAALMGARGIAGAKASGDLKRTQENKAWHTNNDSIQAREKVAQGQHDTMEQDRAMQAGQVPDWMHDQPPGQADMISGGSGAQPDMISSAHGALDSLKQNDSANDAPLGGYYTTDGSQKAMQDSSALTNDMKTAEDGMRGGGMMGSLQRKGLY